MPQRLEDIAFSGLLTLVETGAVLTLADADRIFRRWYLTAAFVRAKYNQSAAAISLGIHYNTFARLAAKAGVDLKACQGLCKQARRRKGSSQ